MLLKFISIIATTNSSFKLVWPRNTKNIWQYSLKIIWRFYRYMCVMSKLGKVTSFLPSDLSSIHLISVSMQGRLLQHVWWHIFMGKFLQFEKVIIFVCKAWTDIIKCGSKFTWYDIHNIVFTWKISCAPWDTFPEPVNTKVMGPMLFGIMSKEISYPASLKAYNRWFILI